MRSRFIGGKYLKKQKPETENVLFGFEVAFETLGESTCFPSKMETRKLKRACYMNEIRKLIFRLEELLGISEDDEPFRGFHEGTM
jgi:hypothetical protein